MGSENLLKADVAARLLTIKSEADGKPWAIISVERENGDVDVVSLIADSVEELATAVAAEAEGDCVEMALEHTGNGATAADLDFS